MSDGIRDGLADLHRQESVFTVNTTAAAINGLSAEIGEWSESKGFREDWAGALIAESSAQQSNVISTKLMLTVSELSEALETLRDNGADGVLKGEGNFGEELADAVIRILDLAHMIGSPIGDEIMRKVESNNNRPYKHGRQF